MKLSKYVDYSLLKANSSEGEIKKLCAGAKKLDVHAVCVNPCYVRMCRQLLRNSGIEVIGVVGYPLGQNLRETKIFEAQRCFRDGADEIDIVMNIGEFRSKKYDFVLNELKAVVNVAKKLKKKSKVIIEASYLADNEIKKASLLVLKSGADFVKTGTGFAKPATAHEVELIKKVVKNKIGIKAAGGIDSKWKMLSLMEAGATRIGTSYAPEILK